MSSEIPFSLVYMLHRASCCVETHPFFPSVLPACRPLYIPPASNTSVSLYAHTHVTGETIHPGPHASLVSVALATHIHKGRLGYHARIDERIRCGREGGREVLKLADRSAGALRVCATDGVGVEIGSAGLAYIHTELSHQHTLAALFVQPRALSRIPLATVRAPEIARVYKSVSGKKGCLNLDGGRPVMRASERGREEIGKEVNARCVVYSKACITCEIFCKTVVENADATASRCVLLIAFTIHKIEMKFMYFKLFTLLQGKFIFIHLSSFLVRNVYFLMKT